MTPFFVDANVVVYAVLPSDYREPCLEVLGAIARGDVDGRTSTAVLEEVWHLELARRPAGLEGLARRGHAVFAPLLPVTDEAFRLALELRASRLGANDRLHAATCLDHGIDVIVSAEADFDELGELRRVDPLDAPARRELLTGARA